MEMKLNVSRGNRAQRAINPQEQTAHVNGGKDRVFPAPTCAPSATAQSMSCFT